MTGQALTAPCKRMAHAWTWGRRSESGLRLFTYWSYKLFDGQNNIRAQGRGRVPDFWQDHQGAAFLDLPRTATVAEFYAVIRGIIAAQEAGYDKAVIHTASSLLVSLVTKPIEINSQALRTMRDFIIELGAEI